MALNPGKCHYLIINNDIINASIELGEKILYAEAEQKLLGIIIDKDLNFQSHTKSIIKTANQKLSALIRVTPWRKRNTIERNLTKKFSFCYFVLISLVYSFAFRKHQIRL